MHQHALRAAARHNGRPAVTPGQQTGGRVQQQATLHAFGFGRVTLVAVLDQHRTDPRLEKFQLGLSISGRFVSLQHHALCSTQQQYESSDGRQQVSGEHIQFRQIVGAPGEPEAGNPCGHRNGAAVCGEGCQRRRDRLSILSKIDPRHDAKNRGKSGILQNGQNG